MDGQEPSLHAQIYELSNKCYRIKAVPAFQENTVLAGMISNQLNVITGLDPEADALKKLGNRIKSLRIAQGHLNYEKFAYQHGIGRMLLRRAETGNNISYKTLLLIISALDSTPSEFFSEGMD